MAVGLEEAEQLVAVAAHEERERVAARGVFLVGARERVGQPARVDEGARVETALRIDEAHDRGGRGRLAARLLADVVGREEARQQRDRVERGDD
jgi:hypothetical protein